MRHNLASSWVSDGQINQRICSFILMSVITDIHDNMSSVWPRWWKKICACNIMHRTREEHRDKEVYYAKSKVWPDVKQSALKGRKEILHNLSMCVSPQHSGSGPASGCRTAQSLLVSVPRKHLETWISVSLASSPEYILFVPPVLQLTERSFTFTL